MCFTSYFEDKTCFFQGTESFQSLQYSGRVFYQFSSCHLVQDELKVDYVVSLSLEERLEGDISMRSSQSFQFKPLNVEMERINQAMHSAVFFNFFSVFKYFKDINIKDDAKKSSKHS